MLKKTGKICGVRATGMMIIVEMLNPEESMNTKLVLTQNAKVPPQGYIVDIGPSLEGQNLGFKVGDRVLLQGNFVPIPRFTEGRDMGVVQPHDIKCVFLED